MWQKQVYATYLSHNCQPLRCGQIQRQHLHSALCTQFSMGNKSRTCLQKAVNDVDVTPAWAEVLSHGWVSASLSAGDTLSFPLCLDVFRREGEGVRVFWDRLREPSFTSRWNPFATDFPFITFTYHPVRSMNDTFAALCDVSRSLHDNKCGFV